MENNNETAEVQGTKTEKRKASTLSVLKQLNGTIRNLTENKLIGDKELEDLTRIKSRLTKKVMDGL